MLFSVQTPAAGGTAFAQFAAAWCYDGNGYILNDTGTSLDVRIGASGSVITLAASALLPIKLVNSMAELYVRRTDQSTTQVTVEAQVGTGSAGGGTTPVQAGVIAAATAAASTAAHDAVATAHGFGVYTVAQLNAFTSANRPIGCVYCSDCLTPEGVGSPVVWSGTKWVVSANGGAATTTLYDFYKALRETGRNLVAEAVTFRNQAALPFGEGVTKSGTGAGTSPQYDYETEAWSTGTTSAGFVSDAAFAAYATLSGSGQMRTGTSIYCSERVFFSALSTASDEYNYRRGLIGTGTTLAAAEVAFVYDRGNTLGVGNSGNSGNWIALTRRGSVNTATILDAGPAISQATAQLLEIVYEVGVVNFYINGAIKASHQTNIPTGVYTQARSIINKTSYTSVNVVRYGSRRFAGIRY